MLCGGSISELLTINCNWDVPVSPACPRASGPLQVHGSLCGSFRWRWAVGWSSFRKVLGFLVVFSLPEEGVTGAWCGGGFWQAAEPPVLQRVRLETWQRNAARGVGQLGYTCCKPSPETWPKTVRFSPVFTNDLVSGETRKVVAALGEFKRKAV